MLSDNISILLAISVLAVVVYVCHSKTKKEINENFGINCSNCNRNNWIGESDCMSCNNCGWCIDPNGYGSCAIGNANGPLFKDCSSWYYNGVCMWGPQCGSVGPIYYDNPIIEYPWYTRWWYMGRRPWRRHRPWRRRRRYYRRPRRFIRRGGALRVGGGARRLRLAGRRGGGGRRR